MSALALVPRLDLSQAGALAAELRAREGAPLELDAGAVTHLGGLGLQLLLAAAADWRARGLPFSIHPRSEAFDEAVTLFGVDPDALQSPEAA